MPIRLVQPQRLTSQPQGAAGVDTSSRLTSASLPNGATLLDVTTSAAWTVTGSMAASVGPTGRTVKTASGAYLSRPFGVATGPVTVVLAYTPTTVSGTLNVWSFGNTATSGAPLAMMVRNGADLRMYAGSNYRATFSGVCAVGKPLFIAFCFSELTSYASTDMVMAVNGQVQTSTFSNGSGERATEYIGSGFFGQDAGNHAIHASAATFLTNAQARSLSLNPWQIFAPAPSPLWIPVSGGGGGDVSVSLTGVSASAQSGTLAAALAAALSGVQGAGSVGSMAAALAATVSGNSATASAGSLAAALRVALSGLSASGGIGTVTASTGGNVSVSLTGVSVAAAAGTVVPGLVVGVSGASGSGSVGSVAQSRAVGLSGAQGIGQAGTATASGGVVQVRTKGIRKTRYLPSRVPQDVASLPQFLQGEFERVNDGLESPFTHQLFEKLYAEPSRKLDNVLVFAYADGTQWNPGSGEGLYAYYAGTWKKVI